MATLRWQIGMLERSFGIYFEKDSLSDIRPVAARHENGAHLIYIYSLKIRHLKQLRTGGRENAEKYRPPGLMTQSNTRGRISRVEQLLT